MPGFIPGKDTIPGEALSVLHDLMAVLVLFVVDKVGNKEVDRFFPVLPCLTFGVCVLRLCRAAEAAEHIQYALISGGLYFVIAVDDLEIKAGRVLKTCVDRASVSLVGLVDRAHYSFMFSFQPVRDLRSPVGRAVVHYKDLDLFSSDQKRLDAVLHIIL